MHLEEIAQLRKGSYLMIENEACIVTDIAISKTGKHGHAKARLEAVGVLDGKKRIIVKPGDEKVQIPMIEKKRAQIISLSKQANTAEIMDLETYETLTVRIDDEITGQVADGKQVEYWTIGDNKVIKRIVG